MYSRILLKIKNLIEYLKNAYIAFRKEPILAQSYITATFLFLVYIVIGSIYALIIVFLKHIEGDLELKFNQIFESIFDPNFEYRKEIKYQEFDSWLLKVEEGKVFKSFERNLEPVGWNWYPRLYRVYPPKKIMNALHDMLRIINKDNFGFIETCWIKRDHFSNEICKVPITNFGLKRKFYISLAELEQVLRLLAIHLLDSKKFTFTVFPEEIVKVENMKLVSGKTEAKDEDFIKFYKIVSDILHETRDLQLIKNSEIGNDQIFIDLHDFLYKIIEMYNYENDKRVFKNYLDFARTCWIWIHLLILPPPTFRYTMPVNNIVRIWYLRIALPATLFGLVYTDIGYYFWRKF